MTREQMKILAIAKKRGMKEIYINNICFNPQLIKAFEMHYGIEHDYVNRYRIKIQKYLFSVSKINFINNVCNKFLDTTIINYIKNTKINGGAGIYINGFYFSFAMLNFHYVGRRLISIDVVDVDSVDTVIGVIDINRIYKIGL